MQTYTNSEVQNGLFERVLAVSAGVPVIWQNDPQDGVTPRWEVAVFFNGNPETGVDGKAVQLGILQVTAVTDSGSYTARAMAEAEKIKAGFRAGQSYGGAAVYSVPAIEGGFKDEAEWRQPVSVYFRFLTE